VNGKRSRIDNEPEMMLKETIAVCFEILLNLSGGSEEDFQILQSENPVSGLRLER
jgi:hypothetical protein